MWRYGSLVCCLSCINMNSGIREEEESVELDIGLFRVKNILISSVTVNKARRTVAIYQSGNDGNKCVLHDVLESLFWKFSVHQELNG